MRVSRDHFLGPAFVVLILAMAALSGCEEERTANPDGTAIQAEERTSQTAPADTPSPAVEEAAQDATPEVPTETPVLPQEKGAVFAVDGIVKPGEYSRSMTLARVEISWSNDAETLRMALDAPGEGYVTVGFDPVDRKVGANYIIGYVKDGEAVVRDHVGTRGNLHEWDVEVGGEDNLLDYAGTEVDGRTVLEFIIPLDSGDPKDRPLAPGATHVVQVAYQSRRDDFVSWHSRHGTSTIELDPAP
ncbi:MAG: hypothetical protein JSW65_02490 [Candidatus Bipolaricaulota bacterium]|nr:MAG: hypothetical protein JSW65_02490 [Candidatus Bipolaricaulota bacterium]